MLSVTQTADLPGHTHPVYAVETGRSAHLFYTAGGEGAVVEWDIHQQKHLRIVLKGNSSIYALHQFPALPFLACGERNGTVQVYDLESDCLICTLTDPKGAVFDLKSTENHLFAASEDGMIYIWDLPDWKLAATIPVSGQALRALAINPGEKQLAAGGKDPFIRFYNISDFRLIKEIDAHTLPVFSLAYANEAILLSGSRDAQLKAWNTQDFRLIKHIPAHLFAVNAIQFNAEARLMASASMDKSIKLWDTQSFDLLKVIDLRKMAGAHRLSVNDITWTDKQNLISVGDDRMVKIWLIRTGGE